MNKAKIAIFGCGWLGEPLAFALQAQGWPVSVCRRDTEQVDRLVLSGLDAHVIKVTASQVIGDVGAWCAQAEVVIVMLPPRSKSQTPDIYQQQINQLVIALQSQHVKKVIFISTTGVYAQGDHLLTETSPLKQGSVLVDAEKKMQAAFSSIILRFSGLVDKNRTPARFLAGKQLEAGLTPTNLIHQADCIAVISQLLAQDWQPDIYNVSTENGLARADFYIAATAHAGLIPPVFTNANSQPKRSVSSQKILQYLNYQFQYPNILTWLTNET
ncbi:NAD(P)H-binding protein [Motilimonas sp. E26]|uniref:NAD(P)H-binding protein n=1 Tax=Motilimonas sp. E26 TaxID=2865674 RepID=UPI001E4B8EDE|nr:NAD(P)H-binding protein [Motilimonas sp. E26]MCE0559036.1 NAD(P)H-binding protein [Motilimonas sp. E26]